MAEERLREYEDMKRRGSGGDGTSVDDQKWDRDWDAAHGHEEDDMDDDDDEDLDNGRYGRQGGRHDGDSAQDYYLVEEDVGHRHGLKQQQLSPRSRKAREVLSSAKSDFDGASF